MKKVKFLFVLISFLTVGAFCAQASDSFSIEYYDKNFGFSYRQYQQPNYKRSYSYSERRHGGYLHGRKYYHPSPRADRGHWEWREERVWVPAVRQTDIHGNVIFHRPGYYKINRYRVWVNY